MAENNINSTDYISLNFIIGYTKKHSNNHHIFQTTFNDKRKKLNNRYSLAQRIKRK